MHVQSLSAEVDVIRQSMSVLRKEAQSAQHKPLDRLEEVRLTDRQTDVLTAQLMCDVWHCCRLCHT